MLQFVDNLQMRTVGQVNYLERSHHNGYKQFFKKGNLAEKLQNISVKGAM